MRSIPPKRAFRRTAVLLAVVFAAACPDAGALTADAGFIDGQVMAKAQAAKVSVAPRSDDGEFQRRLWLDLMGTIPDANEARRFLQDTAPDKRRALVERLMADPRFPIRMAEAFHVQLMERAGDDEQWLAYLTASMQANKPWDVLVREILSPDFNDEHKRPAGYFMTRRLEKIGSQETDYPGLTRDVGRMFMGLDLQCCQCHNHLTVKDYKQVDFNGLFLVFQNLKLNEPGGDHKTKWLSEGMVEAKFEFTSVLTGAKGATGPRVPLGAEIEIPALSESERWVVPPDKKTRNAGVPRFSPLRTLSEKLTSRENPYFARNIVNRLWWQFMGRGLVEPLDLNHAANPASHPELMAALAATMGEREFDLRWLVKEIVLSETYQRSGRRSDGGAEAADDLYALAMERQVSAEQFLKAFLTATGEYARVVDGKGWEEMGEPRQDFKKVRASFLRAFANAAKEPELRASPSLRGALFLRNNTTVLWALQPRKGNLVERLSALQSPDALAEEAYLSIFSRLPTEEERRDVQAILNPTADRGKTISQLVWAMTASMEFFTNH